jgi:hypothetical protein
METAQQLPMNLINPLLLGELSHIKKSQSVLARKQQGSML